MFNLGKQNSSVEHNYSTLLSVEDEPGADCRTPTTGHQTTMLCVSTLLSQVLCFFLLHRAPCDKMLSYATPSERVISFISHLYNCLPCRRGDDHLNKETMSKLVILVWLRILTSGMMKCNSAQLLFSLNPAQKKKRNPAHTSGAMLTLSWCRES